MVTGESLFERLRHAGSRRPQDRSDDRTLLVRSIAANLQRILASREGHAPAQMDYGIPAPSEVAQLCGDGIETMASLVKRCIERYEPRLADISVMHVETEADHFEVVFTIRGRLASLPERPFATFDTFVDKTGQLLLRS